MACVVILRKIAEVMRMTQDAVASARCNDRFAVHTAQIFVHSDRRTESPTAVARSARGTSTNTRRCHQTMNSCATFDLTAQISVAPSFRPGRQGCSREALHEQVGTGVLRVALCKATPGRRPATPPFRHYERNVRTHQCETQGHRSCAPPAGFAKAGSGPTIAAVERREASVAVAMQGATLRASAGLRHWPAKGASQAPERLSALRSLAFVRGRNWQSSEVV